MRNKNHIYLIFRFISHLWKYNENKNHRNCGFRIILDTYGIIMRNENHIYCVFRFILDIYGNIMKIKKPIYCVFRITLDTYGIIMKIKIRYIVFFGLFWTLLEL